ncbi:MAG TPA: hypothetical protein VKE40_13290 [Gemmataceae bacterium]|nr:hypothetical protein [Gemmataceae bacterium]
MLIVQPSANARLVEAWPYEKLTKHSDLIVIAVPLKTKASAERVDFDRGTGAYLQAVVTTFAVKAKLKGECGATIDVVHYQLKFEPKKLGVIEDAPNTLSFDVELGDKAERDYCLFLKATKDKQFGFVSGRDDPQFSVRELRPAKVK